MIVYSLHKQPNNLSLHTAQDEPSYLQAINIMVEKEPQFKEIFFALTIYVEALKSQSLLLYSFLQPPITSAHLEPSFLLSILSRQPQPIFFLRPSLTHNSMHARTQRVALHTYQSLEFHERARDIKVLSTLSECHWQYNFSGCSQEHDCATLSNETTDT